MGIACGKRCGLDTVLPFFVTKTDYKSSQVILYMTYLINTKMMTFMTSWIFFKIKKSAKMTADKF